MIFKSFSFFHFHKLFNKNLTPLTMTYNKEEEIYQEEIVETKVDDDEMSAEEGGFMQGYNEE